MYATIYITKYTSIIKKLDLEDLQKELIISNWLDFINHLETLINKNYFRYRLFTTISIIGGISIPAINVFPFEEPVAMMIVSILGVVTASCIGLNENFKFNDKWKHFRRQVEMSRIEGERYIALSGEGYEGKSHKEALPVFTEKLSAIKVEEIKGYFNTINKQVKTGTGKSIENRF